MTSAENPITAFGLESPFQKQSPKSLEVNYSLSTLQTPKASHKLSCASEKQISKRSLLDNTPDSSNRSTNDGSRLSCFTEEHESIQCLDSELIPSSERSRTMIMKEAPKILIRRPTKSLDEDLKQISMPYEEVVPVFGSYGPCASSFSFLTEKRTALLHTNKFSTAFAKEPLPSSGKHKFSVYIEECKKMNPKLYIGVVSDEQRNESMAYKQGWTFISCFSPQSYLSGQKLIKENLLPRRGHVVTVSVDQDLGWITFEVNGTKMIEGKMSLSKLKKAEIYPFICLGEEEGRVCFI